MSYPKEIDDATSNELRAELDRRHLALQQGLCPYCSQSIHKHTCKYAPLAPGQPQRIEEYHQLIPQDSPYFFYALRSQQDAYAFIQRTIFHIHLCGFWVNGDFTVGNSFGACPQCLQKMPAASIQVHPSPTDLSLTEKVQGWGCAACQIFVPHPIPPIIAPCPICREPQASEPTGKRCVWCQPLSRANKGKQNPLAGPSQLPQQLARNVDTQFCLKCGGLALRKGSCYVCQECGETSSCG